MNWNKYIQQSHNPEKSLHFPSNSNQLSKQHNEFFELKYVYELAKMEILSTKTPKQIEVYSRDQISRMDNKLENYASKKSKELFIHNSDPPIIKKVKTQGNRILKNNTEDVPAWRIDFSLLFEKFVQYIFRQISREIGARQFENYKIHRISGYSPQWSLRYLEPDIFIDKNTYSIIVDAKYKSHLYNYQSLSESLKEAHREDLHQLFAYTSFAKGTNRLSFLCYPQDTVYYKVLDYFSSLTEIDSKLVLLGIPLSKNEIPRVRETIRSLITEYEISISETTN